MPVQESDITRLLGATLPIPLRAALALLPPDWWKEQATLSRTSADACAAAHPAVGTMRVESIGLPAPENEYVPFQITH